DRSPEGGGWSAKPTGWGIQSNLPFTPPGFSPGSNPGEKPPSPKGEGKPALLAISGKRGNVEELVAVSAAAERLGLRPGMALAQARGLPALFPPLPPEPRAHPKPPPRISRTAE